MLKILFLVFTFFFGCGKHDIETQKKPLVLVSLAPYQNFVRQIAGDTVDVMTIVPPNMRVHTFEPKPREVKRVHEAAVWFYVGEPFEKRILPVIQQQNHNLIAIDLRTNLPLISYKEDQHAAHCSFCMEEEQDRHIWMSPHLMEDQVKLITKVLSSRFPEHADLYHQNEKIVIHELELLNSQIKEILEPLKTRTILVSHPAFAYFCADYGCDQISVEYEGKDPLPKQFESILEVAHKKNAEVVIILPQYNNKGAQLVAKELKIPVFMINPYSFDYFKNLRTLALIIAKPESQKNAHN